MQYVFMGLLSGVISGMGMGGGTLLIPLLVLLGGVAQHEAQGANLVAYLPAAAIALVVHIRAGKVDKAVFKGAIAGGIIGALCGTAASLVLTGEFLRKAFAVFLLALAVNQFVSGERKHRRSKRGEL